MITGPGARGFSAGIRLRVPPQATAALGAVVALVLVGLATGMTEFLLLPVAALAVPLVARPRAVLVLTLTLVVMAEGPTFGLFGFTSRLYEETFKGLTPLDGLVILTVAAVGIDALRHRRAVRMPTALALPLGLLVLGMIAGAITGHAAGASVRSVVLSQNVLAYLVVLPLAIVNLDFTSRQVEKALRGALVLAGLKAVLGIVVIVGGYGEEAVGAARLTYYEPAANWLMMIAVLGIVATVVARLQPARWVLLPGLLLVASLVLSYRRSFWIALAAGVLLVILLGLSPSGRRLLIPVGVLVGAAIWALGSVGFQAQTPVVERVRSLAPSKLLISAQDRYRLDERANVLGEIRRRPVSGLGMTIPWRASVRPLGVEHEYGREYVHVAALWYWLKLGILGLAAYLSMMAAGLLLAWSTWRRCREATIRAFGVASFCGLVGLLVMETTASFTGVDPRFTVLFAAQLGLLAVLARAQPSQWPRSAA